MSSRIAYTFHEVTRFTDSKVRLLEAHLIGYSGADFYGVKLRVLLCAFIRESFMFTTLEALRNEIEQDCSFAREYLVNDETLQLAKSDPRLVSNSHS